MAHANATLGISGNSVALAASTSFRVIPPTRLFHVEDSDQVVVGPMRYSPIRFPLASLEAEPVRITSFAETTVAPGGTWSAAGPKIESKRISPWLTGEPSTTLMMSEPCGVAGFAGSIHVSWAPLYPPTPC